jgi:hypothetical protein
MKPLPLLLTGVMIGIALYAMASNENTQSNLFRSSQHSSLGNP